METGDRTIACGHKIYFDGNFKNWIGALVKHVEECDKAAQILLQSKGLPNKEVGHAGDKDTE